MSEGDDLLGRFFSEFLDEHTFSEFRRIEWLFGSWQDHGSTVSGYPVIRPFDCANITNALNGIFEQSKGRFRMREAKITERFERLIEAFREYCQNIYPSEATAALLLHAKILLFMNDTERVVELVSPMALRPYAVENLAHSAELVTILAQAHLQQGTLERLHLSFIAFGTWLIVNTKGMSPVAVAKIIAPFVSSEKSGSAISFRSALIKWASAGYLASSRHHNSVLYYVISPIAKRLYAAAAAIGFVLLKRPPRFCAPFSRKMNPTGPILVTRAMGGIGDLLMMQPGLEALAKLRGRPIDFAIPRKFFPVFQHDPHVRLVDIDGPPIDVAKYSQFINLSLCPAARYESRTRPHVRRGRVELFARPMGIKRRHLRSQGWHINRPTGAEDEAACDRFLAEKRFGSRPLVGVQPYSRDSYKDHPRIDRIIATLAEDHDLIFFHHVANGLPEGPGLASTAGMGLAQSLALVSRLDAMVCVDSAFLHAAAAYDIPVIALFGPTDPRTFTRHHRHVTILWKPKMFGCVPCWRNQDLPCHVTGMNSASPCIAAISAEEVRGAVNNALGTH